MWGVDSLEFFRWWRFCSGSSAVVAVVVVGFVVAGLFFANCRGVGEERSGGFRFGGAHHKLVLKKMESLNYRAVISKCDTPCTISANTRRIENQENKEATFISLLRLSVRESE